MSTQATCYYCLDLGDLGQEHDADVEFNWYIPRVRREDDYPELEVEHVYVKIGDKKVDVLPLVTDLAMDYIVETCWESVEDEAS